MSPDNSKTLPTQGGDHRPGVYQHANLNREGPYDGNTAGTDARHDNLIVFWQILNVLRKWWWLIALIVTVATALCALVLFRTSPIYKAVTILEVKQQERKIIDVSGIENIVADKEFLITQIELLKSESLAENVIETLNLLADTDFQGSNNKAWHTLAHDEKLRSVVKRFKAKLRVGPVGRSRLIRVSFEHPNPRRAALIANTVTEKFINNSLDRKFNATAFARDFVQDRINIVKPSLETAERELVKYASDNNIILIENNESQVATGSLNRAALVTLDAELTSARTLRVKAEQTYRQGQTSNFGAEILGNVALAELKAQRIELNSEYIKKQALFKPDFPDMIELKSRIDLFDTEISAQSNAIINARRAELKVEYELAQVQENDLNARVNTLKTAVIAEREISIDYTILKRQVDTERTQYDSLLQRLQEVSVSDDLGSNLVQIVDTAKAPQSPFKPNKPRTIILVMLLSGIIGFALSYILEIIGDKIKTPDDVKNKLKHIIMGVIPVLKNGGKIITELENPQSGLSEAYASLRTNLQFSSSNAVPRVIQLTSTRSGEGKSVSSLALAMRFAGLGEPVLLIDADLRLPTFLQGEGSSIGLAGLLTSNAKLRDHIQKTRYEALDLLPSGNMVPNPSEILAGTRFDELLNEARNHYSYIIVDSPPVLGLADALILGAKVDATLLVVEAGVLRTSNVKATIERLAISHTKLLGVVLTKYKASSSGYLDYYRYNYGGGASTYGNTKVGKKTKPHKQKQKLDIT